MNAPITVFIVISAVCALAALTYTVADIVMDFYDRRHTPSENDGDSEEKKEG